MECSDRHGLGCADCRRHPRHCAAEQQHLGRAPRGAAPRPDRRRTARSRCAPHGSAAASAACWLPAVALSQVSAHAPICRPQQPLGPCPQQRRQHAAPVQAYQDDGDSKAKLAAEVRTASQARHHTGLRPEQLLCCQHFPRASMHAPPAHTFSVCFTPACTSILRPAGGCRRASTRIAVRAAGVPGGLPAPPLADLHRHCAGLLLLLPHPQLAHVHSARHGGCCSWCCIRHRCRQGRPDGRRLVVLLHRAGSRSAGGIRSFARVTAWC